MTNMLKSKVSVIVTCYNNAKYIEECIQSVESQTISDYEIILVDDFSSDGSTNICKSLSNRYDNIKLLCHDINYGVEKTRNDGMTMATGDWILFLDGDDTLNTNALFFMMESLTEDTDIVYSRFLSFDSISSRIHPCSLCNGVFTISEFSSLIGEMISWPMISCIGNKLYRSAFLKQNDIRFDDQYHFNEDGAFAINALMCAKTIIYTSSISYRYRHNLSGSMNSYRKNAFHYLYSVSNLLQVFFTDNGCGEAKTKFIENKRTEDLIHSLRNEAMFGSRHGFESLVSDCKTKYGFSSVNNVDLSNIKIANKILFDLMQKDICTIIYRNWMYKLYADDSLTGTLKEQGISKIAIYGAGILGTRLATDAEKNNYEVLYFIDKFKTDIINNKYFCLPPTSELPPADIIIVTVATFYNDIKEFLEGLTTIPIIALWDLFK